MSAQANSYTPIAVGFFLLAAPLVVALFLAEADRGRWTNGIAALVMIGCGALLLIGRGRR